MLKIIYDGPAKPEHEKAFMSELTVRIPIEIGATGIDGEYVIDHLDYDVVLNQTEVSLNGPNPSITDRAKDQVRQARRALERALDGVADTALRASLQAAIAGIPDVDRRVRVKNDPSTVTTF